MAFTVYMHTTPDGKVYVGITSMKLVDRWGKSGNGYKKNRLFSDAIQKYGWENIKHEVIKIGLTQEEASAEEMYLINKYKSSDPQFGYNSNSGGFGGNNGFQPSEETKAKIRLAFQQGRIGFAGKHHTQEAKIKMSAAKKGKPQSEEHKRKRGEAMRGRKMTEEQKEKIRATKVGPLNPNYGKHLTQKQKDAISRKVLCVETGQVFSSGIEAANFIGAKASTGINNALSGRAKTSGGYHWRYADSAL